MATELTPKSIQELSAVQTINDNDLIVIGKQSDGYNAYKMTGQALKDSVDNGLYFTEVE